MFLTDMAIESDQTEHSHRGCTARVDKAVLVSRRCATLPYQERLLMQEPPYALEFIVTMTKN